MPVGIFSMALVVAAAACGGRPEASGASAEPEEPTAPAAGRTIAGKAPARAIVLLEPRTPRDFPVPTEPVAMDQIGQEFYPGLLLARAGQPVQFRNSEDVMHNVRVRNRDTDEAIFNVSTPSYKAYTHTFTEPGDYAVSCDIHPAMSASILITTTPYATIADSTGAFSFDEVRPGSYTLTAFNQGRRLERVVEITDATTELRINETTPEAAPADRP